MTDRKLKRMAMKKAGVFKNRRKEKIKAKEALWNPKLMPSHFGKNGRIEEGR